MNVKPRQRTSRHAGKPNARRGTVVGKHPVFNEWDVKPILHQGRVTHVTHDGGLPFCRELAVHLAAGAPFGIVKPPRAFRIAVATVRPDTHDEIVRVIEKTGLIPAHRIAIHRLRFDYDGELQEPNELIRILRSNSSEILITECGRGALIEVRKHLADFSGPLLAPIDPPADHSNAIVLRLRDDKTFEISNTTQE